MTQYFPSTIRYIFDPEKGLIQEIGEPSTVIFASGTIVEVSGVFAYVPEDPANWSAVPTNLIEAVDYLAAGSGSGGGGGGSPGGANGDIQYRVNAGTFGGTSKITFVGGNVFVTGSFFGDVVGTSSYATTAAYLENNLNLASVLTYEGGLFPNTATAFGNWDDLWTAYQASTGTVDIYVLGGFTLFPITPVTYSFRPNTKLKGLTGTYGVSTFINTGDNVCFENLYNFEGIQLTHEGNLAPLLVYNSPTYTYPNVFLNRSTFWCSGSAPMISWSQDKNSGQLNIELLSVSSFTSSNGPVFYNSGSGIFNSRINLFLGQGCQVFANSVAGNASSEVELQLRDGTAIFNKQQPGLSGTLNGASMPLASDTLFEVNFSENAIVSKQVATSRIIQGFDPPSPFGIPAQVINPGTFTTTSSVPLLIFSSSVPPVISALFNLDILARESTTPGVSFDSYAAEVKGLVTCDAINGLQFGALGLTASFEDRTPGASTWTFSSSINTPAAGDFNLYVIGENSKTINWTLIQRAVLGMGI